MHKGITIKENGLWHIEGIIFGHMHSNQSRFLILSEQTCSKGIIASRRFQSKQDRRKNCRNCWCFCFILWLGIINFYYVCSIGKLFAT